ncbi:MAG: hypothetical protein K2J70_08560 [Muribaculaceae bacterium]|nr:hypothetical protein [Muribaculaceae bacterium]
MASFYCFNPETDLALAQNRDCYTPNKKIKEFRDRLALLPSLWGREEDYIIIPDNPVIIPENLPLFHLMQLKRMKPVRLKDLKELVGQLAETGEDFLIEPWGWNKDFRKTMLKNGIPVSKLPSLVYLKKVRELSHRRTSTLFFKEYGDFFPACAAPIEITNLTDLRTLLTSGSDFCLKAPWSSSGRGVVFTTQQTQAKIMEWVAGTIRSQGSVMVESLFDRTLDFASEWISDNNGVHFCGLSLFKCSERGKYQGNYLLSQTEIESVIARACDWNQEIIEKQKEFLTHHIAPYYKGYVGIDMLAEGKTINPCVEINLRHTMGHVAIGITEELIVGKSEAVKSSLSSLFPGRYFLPTQL